MCDRFFLGGGVGKEKSNCAHEHGVGGCDAACAFQSRGDSTQAVFAVRLSLPPSYIWFSPQEGQLLVTVCAVGEPHSYSRSYGQQAGDCHNIHR